MEHKKHYRPWGYYEILATGPGYKVKRLVVDPGKRTSLQWHEKRDEDWMVIGGDNWEFVRQFPMPWGKDNRTRSDSNFTKVSIAKKERHRTSNTGTEPLVIIEVQTFDENDPSGEEDIHRIEDDYGREVEL